jgi:hypothetical protein
MSDRRLLRADQIDFSDAVSTPVVSDSFRFVLPVPAWPDGGEPLVRPDGAPLTDRDGRLIEGRGIAFIDPDDRCWEVARGDGSAVILFSPVTEATAAALMRRIRELATTLADLTIEDLRALIAFAVGELGIRASYATSKAVVADTMIAEPTAAASGCGLHRRRADQVCRAVYVPGAGAFLGPAASPQLFADGAVILKHGDSVRVVQPISFEAGYRFLDGRPARVAELASQSP